MFDLHMHTTLSDGELSVEQLVNRLKERNIQVFAITDHNHALAYETLEVKDINMIKGTEITTSFEGTIVEVLGYHIDHSVINNWYRDFFSDENIIKNEIKLFNELKDLANKKGYNIPTDLEMDEVVKGQSKKTVFYYLDETLDDFEFKTYKEFFRKGLSNPASEWFIDEGRYYPSLKEVIDLIHEAGGIAFLAHPFEYGFKELNPLFNEIRSLGIDGIECYHPSAPVVQSVKLARYCTDNNLFGSGGSDFHRDARGIAHGVHAHEDILKLACFDWLREYL